MQIGNVKGIFTKNILQLIAEFLTCLSQFVTTNYRFSYQKYRFFDIYVLLLLNNFNNDHNKTI